MMTHPHFELWYESWEDLVRRWYARQPADTRPAIEMGDVIETARRRAETLLGYAHARSQAPLAGVRGWETRWNALAAWQNVERLLARFGWKARRIQGRVPLSNLTPLDAQAVEESVVLIYESEMDAAVEAYGAAGSPYPFTLSDVAVLALAAELYRVASEKIGRGPREAWVDELALPLFQQRLLGLPFSPLAAELAAMA